MVEPLIEDPSLKDKIYVFKDRYDAGRMLALRLEHYRGADALILAIPSGGVPVAAEISAALGLPLDLIITRKLQIPFNREAGFGAVSPDGEIVLNEVLLQHLRLTDAEVDAEIKRALDLIKKREGLFRKGRPLPDVGGKIAIIVDDGLASGYTMLAAVRFIKKQAPRKIVVAVPTGLERTLRHALEEVDEVVCLNVRSGSAFAVAEAYRTWYDLSDDEVLSLVKRIS